MAVARERPTTKKVARKKPAAAKPTGVFGGLKPATAPITEAQTQARTQVRKATRKAEAKVVVPYVPKLAHPTDAQRAAAGPAVARSLHAQGITTREQARQLPKAQRDRYERAAGYQKTLTRPQKAAAPRKPEQLKAGPEHSHVLGIDTTAAGRLAATIGEHLKGNPLAAAAKGAAGIVDYGSKHLGAPGRSFKTLVDLPANTVTSTYHLATHPLDAPGELYTAAKETLSHPLHDPLATVLVFRGVKGAGGHTTGRVMRTGVLGKGAKQVASVKRAPKTLPGAKTPIRRQYSSDPTSKLVQVATDKLRVKHEGKLRGLVTHPDKVTARDLRRRTDEDVQAAKMVTAENQAKVAKRVKKAIGRKPTAATSTTAQGITTASRADLQAYLRELQDVRKALTDRTDAKRNEQAQKLLRDALKSHDEAKVHKAASAYSAIRQEQETQALALNLVNPKTAEATRLVGPAVRRLKVTPETKRAALTGAKAAVQGAKVTRRAALKTEREAKQTLEAAKVKRSRVTGAQSVQKGPQAMARLRAGAEQPTRARGVLAYIDEAMRNPAALRKGAAAEGKRVKQRAKAQRAVTTAKATVTVARKQRVAANKAVRVAASQQRQIKRAPYATAAGKPVDVAEIRAAMGPNAIEPAFVSHQDIPARSAAIPKDRPRIPVKENRTGQAVTQGTLDLHPAKLGEQAAETQRLIDSAKARERIVEDWGHRENAGADVTTFKKEKRAENYARANHLNDDTGQQWSVIRRQDGTFALMPSQVVSRLAQHEQAGFTHPAIRALTSNWRRNTLGWRPTWFVGNTLEAALRSLISQSGPGSYVFARRTLAELKRTDPVAYQQARARTVGGGHFSMSDRIARERATGKELGKFAQAVHRWQRTKTGAGLGSAYGAWSHFVFNSLNGRIESTFQTAMLGRALRDHPLMDQHVVNISRRAVEDAANGLRNTDVQVELGRAVDRMYGKYGKFSPQLQGLIAQYTPFISWTLNSVRFLYNVLPKDHPVLTALLTSANQATQEWRKQKGLYLDVFGDTKGQVPPWLMGSIPGKDGSHLRIGRYTPFGLLANESGSPVGDIGGLVLPQVSEILQNLRGNDWTEARLSKDPSFARDLLAAIASFAEGQIPAAQVGVPIAGVRLPNVRDKAVMKTGLKAVDPFRYTASKPATTATRVSKKAGTVDWGDTSGGGIQWSDQAAGGVSWGG